MKYKYSFLFILLFLLPLVGSTQVSSIRDTSLFENQILYRKEYRAGVMLHSAGFGISFRKAAKSNAFKKQFWEAGIHYNTDLKEVRITNPWYSNSKSYVYGKLNDIVISRIGYGVERLIASKPFMGGVEVNFNYSGGFSFALTKPVYLNVIEYTGPSQEEAVLALRKYDPDEHFYDNIYGRASFMDGIEEVKFYPGVYARAGFDFEFGNYSPLIRALELGLSFDLYPVAVPSMAFNDPKNLFTHFYLSFSLGRRYN